MIIYFALYTFLGYLMESIYISCFKKRLVSSGLFQGPFIPLYGIGACILIKISPLIQHSYLLILIIGGISMTLLELITSYYIEKIYHTKCWDYSHLHFHFQGRICLLYFIIWCLLSLIFILYIHTFFQKIPYNDINILISLIYILFLSKAIFQKEKTKIL